MKKSLILAGISFAVTLGVIMGAWLLFGNREAGAEPDVTPSGGGTPPDQTATGLIDDRGSGEIPWAEVGPGWFLLDWAEVPADRSVAWTGNLSLVSPAGEIYSTGLSFDSETQWGLDWVPGGYAYLEGGWDPEGVVLQGDVVTVNLQTGGTSVVFTDVVDPNIEWTAADGSFVGYWWPGDGMGYQSGTAGGSLESFCWGYGHTGLSPSGNRLVCLGYREDGRTDVILADPSGAASETIIDEFRLPPSSYELHGWLDNDTFFFSRAEGTGRAFFAYNVATKKIADYTLPFAADYTYFQYLMGPSLEYYSGPAVFVNHTHSDVVRFRAANGTPLATISCADYGDVYPVTISGNRAIVQCGTYGAPALVFNVVDLDTGAVTLLGPFVGSGASISASFSGYPETY